MTEIVTFDLNSDSSSIQRARETPVEVTTEPWGASYLAAFEDSDDVHEVVLSRDVDGWHGDCWILDENGERTGRCRGWVHHDGPCAHLWAVRSHVAYDRLSDPDERYSGDGGERRLRSCVHTRARASLAQHPPRGRSTHSDRRGETRRRHWVLACSKTGAALEQRCP